MAPAELSPAAVPGTQAVTLSTQVTKLTPAQAAWQRFVDQVEWGEITDPSGQYVAKGTRGATDANGHRSSRPKFDAATPDFARHFNIKADGKGGVAIKAGSPITSVTNPDTPPCDGCPIGGVGSGIYSTFTTSENLGGSGYIHDLKLVTDANSLSRDRALSSGYTFLNADLNKGAGGSYIYFCFQRNPSSRPLS